MRKRANNRKNGENKRILIVSIIIVILGAIGFFAYAKVNMAKNIERALREVVITDVSPQSFDRDLDTWNYRLTIAIYNPSDNIIDVTASSLELFAGNLSLGSVKPVGDWRVSLGPNKKNTIIGDVQISPATAELLRDKDEVELHAKGKASMNAKYFFYSSFRDQYWDVSKKLKVY
jgi:hypothetical protein